MKRSKSYPTVTRRWYRPAEHEYQVCHRPLRQVMTLSRRTVVTLQAVIKLIHAGYRCPDTTCPGRSRTYRSAEADASELRAVEQLWPTVPHQVCQFHVLREASRPGFEADRKVKTALRKRIGEKIRVVRRPLAHDLLHAEAPEAQQLEVLQDYALGIQTALNRDGTLPFGYPGLQAGEDLDAIAESLSQLERKGGA